MPFTVRPHRDPGQDGIEVGERIAPRIVDRENGGVAGDRRRQEQSALNAANVRAPLSRTGLLAALH